MQHAKRQEISRKNVLAHELIGLHVSVKSSTDRAREGIGGKVVDETKNTLKIETKEGEKIMPKEECTFEFALPNGGRVEVQGRKLCFRPEDRVKEYWVKAR